MSRRTDCLIAACSILVAVLLLLPYFTARLIAACLLVTVAAVLLVRALLHKTSIRTSHSNPTDETAAEQQSSADTFELGKLFEATMSGMREGLLVVDSNMRVVASNAAARQLFNLSRGKLDAQRLTELTRNPAIYSAFLDALRGTERSGIRVETHGPERLIFDLRVIPLTSSGGNEAQGALGVFIDITRIERLEGIRQEFLSNVSHELRTPLTAILAFVETLEDGAMADQESSQRFLTIIRRNASRMTDLIDDILELSAIEAGNVPVKADRVELYAVVSDVISSLATRALEQNISLINKVPRAAVVHADPRRLEQMLTNLVENGIKFNRANGSVTIKLVSATQRNEVGTSNKKSGVRDVEDGARDKIIVEDTGEGIPAQHVGRLFERFYRVDRARSREMGGTGLGLAIVKHLARAHGGEVSVSSELGTGSTFTIELLPISEAGVSAVE